MTNEEKDIEFFKNRYLSQSHHNVKEIGLSLERIHITPDTMLVVKIKQQPDWHPSHEDIDNIKNQLESRVDDHLAKVYGIGYKCLGVLLITDDFDIKSLNEKDMERFGWVRKQS